MHLIESVKMCQRLVSGSLRINARLTWKRGESVELCIGARLFRFCPTSVGHEILPRGARVSQPEAGVIYSCGDELQLTSEALYDLMLAHHLKLEILGEILGDCSDIVLSYLPTTDLQVASRCHLLVSMLRTFTYEGANQRAATFQTVEWNLGKRKRDDHRIAFLACFMKTFFGRHFCQHSFMSAMTPYLSCTLALFDWDELEAGLSKCSL